MSLVRRSIVSGLSLILQCTIAFIAGFGTYTFFALIDSDWGFDGMIGLLISLMIGAVLTALSILVCLLIGLPIRLHRTIRTFWLKNTWISIVIFMIGIFLQVFSLLPSNRDLVVIDGELGPIEHSIPDPTFAITGWFMMLFGILHTYLPFLRILPDRNRA